MRRFAWLLALVGMIPAPLNAQPKAVEPALVVQLKSLDGLLGDMKYFANLAGQGDQVAQVDGLIDAWTDSKGPAGWGIDAGRPILAYGIATPGGTDSPFAVMIPVTNEAAFLKIFESLPVKPEKGKDGTYSVEIPNSPIQVYFRFANKYLYVTGIDRDNVSDAKLVAPEKLTAGDANRLLGVSLRLDKIPDDWKQLALSQMERRMAELKDESKPGESPEQTRMRRQGIDMTAQVVKTVLSEGRAFDMHFSVDRANDDIGMGFALDGKPETFMKTAISALGTGKTKFAPARDSAFHAGVNLSVPVMFRPLLATLIDSGVKDTAARETDANKREAMTRLFTAIAPTLKAGVLDVHLAAGSPNSAGKYNFVAGLGVENGMGIESAVKSTLGQLPEAERSNIKLDVSKVGDMNLHQVKVKDLDAGGKRLFGNEASAWAAFAPSAMMLGFGAEPASTFQGMNPGGAPQDAPLLVLEGSISRLAAMDKDPKSKELANKVFGASPNGTDRFRVSLEGGAKLDLKMSIKGLAFKYLAQVGEQKKGN